MLIIGIFEQSIELEQALADLESSSISKEKILVVFMDKDRKKHKYQPHSPHPFEIGISCATGFAVIGASMGFALAWGPLIWGIIGALTGFGVGVGCCSFINGRKAKKPHIPCEATVLIECTEDQSLHVLDVLWNYRALSVGHADSPS
ncbi:hypothetical protein [Paenibacillus hamazuiensis]|uniref:hypothetical protein n=1 Tax=Paenibacillus hamazuiensis TaxID=2936508 RepID=UPI00200CD86C|nr:hypothetical protein [Paenibacillus hamazuiensis]